MIYQASKSEDVSSLSDPEYARYLEGVDIDDWLRQPGNIALYDRHQNVALFTYDLPGVYIGHYFFKQRGREALMAAKKFLDSVFSRLGVEVVVGLTPVENRAARWFSRQIGFQSYGEVETPSGFCEHFILTKREHHG